MRRQELDTKTAIATLVLFVITTAGVVPYLLLKKDFNYLSAYLAFACPCLAAVIAGIGFLHRDKPPKLDAMRARNVVYYFASILLLFFGLLAQLYQRQDSRFLFTIVLIILVITGFFGTLVYRNRANRVDSAQGSTETSSGTAKIWIRPIDSFYLFLAFVAGFVVAMSWFTLR
jgi:hypothetical protein